MSEQKENFIDPKYKLKNKLDQAKALRKKQKPKSDFDILDNVKHMIFDVHENSDVINMNVIDKNNFFKDKYSKLHNDYLPIYNAVLQKHIKSQNDLNMLNLMLNQKKLIDRGRKTEYKASSQIGQVLFDKYVKDNID